MKFSDFVCFEATIAELKSNDRDEVIGELVSALEVAGHLAKGNREKITKAIIERENEASTGMGKGVALPHVKHPAVKRMVAVIGRSNAGMDFCALDKEPVYSIILLMSPADKADEHLLAIENIFRHLQNERFRNFLNQAQTVEQVCDLLKEADENVYL